MLSCTGVPRWAFCACLACVLIEWKTTFSAFLMMVQAWQKYNSPALDFNLCFQTENLQQLEQSLTTKQRHLFQLSWRGAKWQRYMATYMAGMQHSILKQTVPSDAKKHNFVPWSRLPALSSVPHATSSPPREWWWILWGHCQFDAMAALYAEQLFHCCFFNSTMIMRCS